MTVIAGPSLRLPATRAQVIHEMEAWLPEIPTAEKAALLAVSASSYRRWATMPSPAPARARTVACLVSILSRSWTARGVVMWFDKPHPGLHQRRPADLLDDPDSHQWLLAVANGGRAQVAT